MPIVSELILSLMLTASLSAGAPLSAPPGLAVSLPAITAQAQQLHPPLMILHAGGVTPRISAQDFDPGAKVTSILIN